MMLFGIGLAFFLGKPLIQPTAPRLPVAAVRVLQRRPRRCAPRCEVNVLFLVGLLLAPALRWALANTRCGHGPARRGRGRRGGARAWATT